MFFEQRIRDVAAKYKERSEELVEKNKGCFVGLYLPQALRHEDVVSTSHDFNVNSLALAEKVRNNYTEWVDRVMGRYKVHATNFEYAFLKDKDIGMVIDGLEEKTGFDFKGAAEDLRSKIKTILDKSYEKENEEIVSQLLEENGLYAAKAITSKPPKKTAGSQAFVDHLLIAFLDAYHRDALKKEKSTASCQQENL